MTNGKISKMVFQRKASHLGNSGGKGHLREVELTEALHHLGMMRKNIHVLHHPSIQDGLDETWNVTLAASFIEKLVKQENISRIFTFDGKGVSGHPNHVDTYRAVIHQYKYADRTPIEQPLQVLMLHSSPFLSKYIGPFSFYKHLLLFVRDTQSIDIMQWNPLNTIRFLQFHRSQLTWYRGLHAFFSQYTYLNQWEIAQ